MSDKIKIALPSSFSDGNEECWKVDNHILAKDDRIYHRKIADMWMTECGAAEKGHQYELTRLPNGYAVHTRTRKGGVTDRYLLGHARSKFDSPAKFFPHFQWLISEGKTKCACVNCNMNPPSATRKTARTHKISRADPTTDITTTRPIGNVNKPIDPGLNHIFAHSESSQENDKKIVSAYHSRPSLPRLGEVVLFYPNGYSLMSYSDNEQYELHDVSGKPCGFPPWKAGVVCQDDTYENILTNVQPLSAMRSYGQDDTVNFRIECLADPESNDKSVSHQSYWVSANRIRPLTFFRDILSGLPQSAWHHTISNAFKILKTCTLWGPATLVGIYDVTIYECQGMWIGAEHVVLGDAVRIMPQANERVVHRVLVIDRLMCILKDLGQPNHRGVTRIYGQMYTVTPNDGGHLSSSEQAALPTSMKGFTWFREPCSRDSKVDGVDITYHAKWEISCDQILGRMYNKTEMLAMLQVDDFNVGVEGMQEARLYCEKQSLRCKDTWFFGSSRVETLGVELFSGLPVGKGRAREELRKQISDRISPVSGRYHPKSASSTHSRRADDHQMEIISDEETVDDEAAEMIRDTLGGGVFPSDGEEEDEEDSDA